MLRVKCPHCGAGNQDATEDDTCWQCGSVLGSPVTRVEGANRPSATMTSEPTQQLNMEMLRNIPPADGPKLRLQETNTPPRPALNPVVILIGALLIFIIVILLYMLTRH